MTLQESTGANTTTYVYGPTGVLYSVDNAGNATYRLADALGSTVALADGSGSMTDTYAYDVFGTVRSHSGTKFTFMGEHVATAIEPVPSGSANDMPS